MTEPLEPICDSHAHLDFPEFAGRELDVLQSAAEARVTAIINIGTEPAKNPLVVEQVRTLPRTFHEAEYHRTGCHGPDSVGPKGGQSLAMPGAEDQGSRAKEPSRPGLRPDRGTRMQCPALYATVGFHPHESRKVTSEDWPEIERLAALPEVVGLGEFGLDYHYEHSPRDVQKEVLRGGIRLTLRTGLPLVIHSREAGLEVVETLDETAGRALMPRGVFHCFTDPWPVAEAALERGFYIGFTGIATYPSAADVREVIRRVPLERILVETDAPFCTPEPVRSQRRRARRKGKDEPNEPALVGLVCDLVAELHNVPVAEVRRQTMDNTRQLFGLTPDAGVTTE